MGRSRTKKIMLKIKNLVMNQTTDIYLLITSIEEKISSIKQPYVEFMFDDGVDRIKAIMWTTRLIDVANLEVGKVVKITGYKKSYKGNVELNINEYSPAPEIDVRNFIRSAPIGAEEMYDFIYDVAVNISHPEINLLTTTALDRVKEQLLYFPGAQSVHHDYLAGLLYHLYRMLEAGIKLAEIYGESVSKDLLFSGIILHDIGKVDELDSNDLGIAADYTVDGKMFGHLLLGYEMITLLSAELGISKETSRLIKAIIASHHGTEDKGALRKCMFLEAEIVHLLDMIDSRVVMFENANKKIKEDTGFGDKEFFLNNVSVYKHNIK